MTFLRSKGDDFNENLKKMMNEVVKEAFGSLDSITDIDGEQIRGLRAANNSLNSFYDLVEEHCKVMDEMYDKLDGIQLELKAVNRRLTALEEAKKGEEQA